MFASIALPLAVLSALGSSTGASALPREDREDLESRDDAINEPLRHSLIRISVARAGIGMELLTEGSGFLVQDPEGGEGDLLIVTSLHVVRGGTRAMIHNQENEVCPIDEIVAIDEYWDLALLRAELPEGEYVPLTLAQETPEEGTPLLLPVLEHLSDELDTIEGEQRRLLRKTGELLPSATFSKGEAIRTDVPGVHGDSGSPLLAQNNTTVLGVFGILDQYDATDRSISYAIPANRVAALIERSRGKEPVARPYFEFHRQHLMDPLMMIEAVSELINYRDNGLARQVLELTMANAHKLDRPMPREGHYYNAFTLQYRASWELEDDDDPNAAYRDVVAAAEAAVIAPTPRLIDELVLADCLYYLGIAKRELDDDAAARDALLDVIELRPDHIDALVALAELAIAAGKEPAFRIYTRSLREHLGPDAEVVTRLMDEWRGKTGQRLP